MNGINIIVLRIPVLVRACMIWRMERIICLQVKEKIGRMGVAISGEAGIRDSY